MRRQGAYSAGMNYFAHGRELLGEPYMLAGAAVPDWLNVSDRRVRVRRKEAEGFVEDGQAEIAALAQGIVRHHEDDAWFHGSRAFAEVSLELTLLCRDALPEDEGFRPSFLGHILVEILLDAELIASAPSELEAYYRALEEVDAGLVQRGVNRMSKRRAHRLAEFIEGFRQVRFLYDYADDDKLLYRLNQVMRRVKLPALPDSFQPALSVARGRVASRRDDLLAGV